LFIEVKHSTKIVQRVIKLTSNGSLKTRLLFYVIMILRRRKCDATNASNPLRKAKKRLSTDPIITIRSVEMAKNSRYCPRCRKTQPFEKTNEFVRVADQLKEIYICPVCKKEILDD